MLDPRLSWSPGSSPPVWAPASVAISEDELGIIHILYRVPVTGAPGTTIEALLNGSPLGGGTVVLDDTGAGTITLTPDIVQYLLAPLTNVTFRSVLASGVGPSTETSLFSLGYLGAPVEEAPVEEAPVEEAPVEEAPVEEAPVEEAPVQEAPVQEAPVQVSITTGSDRPASPA